MLKEYKWSSPETNKAKTKERMTHFSMARIWVLGFSMVGVELMEDREGAFIERNGRFFFQT